MTTRTLLILDDDPVIRRNWVRMGAHVGVRVLEAAAPDEARRHLEVEPVDLFIADFHLGEHTSESLVRECAGQVRVIVVTGDPDAARSAFGGVDVEIVEKPVAARALLELHGLVASD